VSGVGGPAATTPAAPALPTGPIPVTPPATTPAPAPGDKGGTPPATPAPVEPGKQTPPAGKKGDK